MICGNCFLNRKSMFLILIFDRYFRDFLSYVPNQIVNTSKIPLQPQLPAQIVNMASKIVSQKTLLILSINHLMLVRAKWWDQHKAKFFFLIFYFHTNACWMLQSIKVIETILRIGENTSSTLFKIYFSILHWKCMKELLK